MQASFSADTEPGGRAARKGRSSSKFKLERTPRKEARGMSDPYLLNSLLLLILPDLTVVRKDPRAAEIKKSHDQTSLR